MAQLAPMTTELVQVPIQLLDLAEDQDDSRWDVGDVHELAASIRELGLLQPVGVRPHAEGRFRLVYGHRRVAALSSLGWTLIPAVVVDAPADEDLLRSLTENLLRRNLSSQERAHALERLLASGLSGKEIASRTGKAENVIYSWLRVARSRPLLDALNDGLLGINEARVLAPLPADQLVALLPELEGKPEAFRLARIQRALDDVRTAPPPRGFYKAHVENRTQRLLLQILELMRGVREVRTAEELGLVRDICSVAARWQRDLERASSAPP